LEFLSNLTNLSTVVLRANPIAKRKFYRNIVCSRIKCIKLLDQQTVTQQEQKKLTEKEEQVIDEIQKKKELDEEERYRRNLIQNSVLCLH